ncbi:MAG TPA: hypothetical protein VFX19_04745 [Dehalococcoidia bacterium]|nr:hypothetical protein [Dehalococcoidia bacterium]
MSGDNELLVQLQDWQGIILAWTSIDSDAFDPLLVDVSGLRLVRYIDLYGRTNFNRLQMDDLLLDLEELPHLQPTADAIERLREIIGQMDIPVLASNISDEQLHTIAEAHSDPDQTERVRRLAIRCRDEVDRFLVFQGD